MALLPRPVTMMIWSQPAAMRLLDAVLNDGLVHQRQHFLGLRLGGGQEARAQSCRRKNRLANFLLHECLFLQYVLQRRTVVAQHRAADDGIGGSALLHELVVKLLQAE